MRTENNNGTEKENVEVKLEGKEKPRILLIFKDGACLER